MPNIDFQELRLAYPGEYSQFIQAADIQGDDDQALVQAARSILGGEREPEDPVRVFARRVLDGYIESIQPDQLLHQLERGQIPHSAKFTWMETIKGSGQVHIFSKDPAVRYLPAVLKNYLGHEYAGVIYGFLTRPAQDATEAAPRSAFFDFLSNEDQRVTLATSLRQLENIVLAFGAMISFSEGTRNLPMRSEDLPAYISSLDLEDHARRRILESFRTAFSNQSKLPALIKIFKDADHVFFKRLGDELEPLTKLLGQLQYEHLLASSLQTKSSKLRDVSASCNRVKLDFNAVHALLKFAGFLNQEAEVISFNHDEPVSYEKGWYPAKPRSQWHANDSIADTQMAILCGSNMSGKSCDLQTHFWIQLMAQATGLATVASGNFRFYDQIYYHDRGYTDTDRKMSAFGSEISPINQALAEAGPRTLLLGDENLSSTDDIDAYGLLASADEKFLLQGVVVRRAIHNVTYIRHFEGRAGVRLYHFKIQLDPEASPRNRIKFHHEREDGFDDSHALEVAEMLGMPASVVARARQYPVGIVGPVPIPPWNVTVPEPYTEEERDQMKQEAQGFVSFFPWGNELKLERHFRGGYDFGWRYQTSQGHLGYSSDRHDDRERHPSPPPSPLTLLTQDPEFRSTIFRVESLWGLSGNILADFYQFLFNALVSDPKEILERQRFFARSSEEIDRYYEVYDRWIKYTLSLELLAESRDDLDPINIKLLESIAPTYSLASSDVRHTNAYILLWLKVLGTHLNDFGCEELDGEIARIKKVIDFNRRRSKLDDRDLSGEDHFSTLGKLLVEYSEVLGITGDDSESRLESYRKLGLDLLEVPLEHLWEKAKEKLPKLSLFNEAERAAIDRLRHSLRYVRRFLNEAALNQSDGLFFTLLDFLKDSSDMTDELPEFLKDLDSVHAHQWANYFKPLLSAMFYGVESGEKVFAHLLRTKQLKDELELEVAKIQGDEEYAIEFVRSTLEEKKNQLEGKREQIEASKRVLESLKKPNYREGEDDDLDFDISRKQRAIEFSKETVTRLGKEIKKIQAQPIQAALEVAKERRRFIDLKEPRALYGPSWELISKEWQKLSHIFRLARIIHDGPYVPGQFGSSLEIVDGLNPLQAIRGEARLVEDDFPDREFLAQEGLDHSTLLGGLFELSPEYDWSSPDNFKERIVKKMNQGIIDNPNFFQSWRQHYPYPFDRPDIISLIKKTQKLRRAVAMGLNTIWLKDPSMDALRRLNRLLLEVAYPTAIVPMRDLVQVPNGTTLSEDERVRFLVGANTSGKSYKLKSLVGDYLFFMVSGHAPAEFFQTVPVEGLIFMDRVLSDLDRDLSSNGKEIQFWVHVFRMVERKQNQLLIFNLDEIFSTTSPFYQSALSYAAMEELLSKGHLVMIATHNHDFVHLFHKNYRGQSTIHHFETKVVEGKLMPQFNEVPGWAPSSGIDIAASRGMEPSVITGARELVRPLRERVVGTESKKEQQEAIGARHQKSGITLQPVHALVSDESSEVIEEAVVHTDETANLQLDVAEAFDDVTDDVPMDEGKEDKMMEADSESETTPIQAGVQTFIGAPTFVSKPMFGTLMLVP